MVPYLYSARGADLFTTQEYGGTMQTYEKDLIEWNQEVIRQLLSHVTLEPEQTLHVESPDGKLLMKIDHVQLRNATVASLCIDMKIGRTIFKAHSVQDTLNEAIMTLGENRVMYDKEKMREDPWVAARLLANACELINKHTKREIETPPMPESPLDALFR